MELQELEQKYAELGKAIEKLKAEEKEKEIKYPIYCLSKNNDGLIVKFDQLKRGTIVKQMKNEDVGYSCDYWVEHTNTGCWKQLEVCEKTGFFDGQLIWCWDNMNRYIRVLKFYDAKNETPFNSEGERNGAKWNNYEPYEGNWPQWAQEAFKTLKR